MVENTTIEKFYTCKWSRAFKEILLKKQNRDILEKILETVLKIKTYEIKEENIERNSGNLGVRRKYLDILLSTEKGLIGIELNAHYQEYLRPRNLAFQRNRNIVEYNRVGELWNFQK